MNSSNTKWGIYMDKKFKKDFISGNNENIFIIELDKHRIPKYRCIDSHIIKKYLCDNCKLINCSYNNCSNKLGGSNIQNKYLKQKSSYDMKKLKIEIFNKIKSKNSELKEKKFIKLLNNIAIDIFGLNILLKRGGGKRKRDTNVIPKYELQQDFKSEQEKRIYLVGVKDNDKFNKYVFKMSIVDEDMQNIKNLKEISKDTIDNNQYIHEYNIYKYLNNIKINDDLDENNINCKFIKFYDESGLRILNYNNIETNKIILDNIEINIADFSPGPYLLQITEYNCNYLLYTEFIIKFINNPNIIFNTLNNILVCKMYLFKKYKFIHWDFHSDNLFIDISDENKFTPVLFDFDLSTIKIGKEIGGDKYGEVLLNEYTEKIQKNLNVNAKKDEILEIGLFHDEYRIIFDVIFYKDLDTDKYNLPNTKKYCNIIKKLIQNRYGLNFDNFEDIKKFINGNGDNGFKNSIILRNNMLLKNNMDF